MRIALLTDGIYPNQTGGIQKHSYYLAKYMTKLGYEVDIYSSGNVDDEKLESQIVELGVHNLYLTPKYLGINYPGHYIRESYLFSKNIFLFIKEPTQYDFVYAQGFTGWYYTLMRKQDKSLPPLITNFHGLEMFQKAATVKEKLKQFMFRGAVKKVSQGSDVNCSLGGKLTPILERITSGCSRVIETPIGIGDDWLIATNEFRHNKIRNFVFVGRYERRKGIEELSAVLKNLTDFYEFEFHFIGPIDVTHQIKSSKIHYHGLIKAEPEIKQILKDCDVLVCPSYSEGMPTVILEAMASGCAIIASDVGAVSEQVNPDNGVLIKAGDQSQLTDALIDLINLDEGALIKMKVASIQRIKQKFVWEKVIQQNLHQIRKGIEL